MTAVMPGVSLDVLYHPRTVLTSPPELNKFDPRARPGQQNERVQQAYARTRERNRHSNANVNFVPLVPQTDASASAGARRMGDKAATFGQRRNAPKGAQTTTTTKVGKEGGFEMSWVPSSSSSGKDPALRGAGRKGARKGVEVFGAGMERGDEEKSHALNESERRGRTQRRKGMRSGSKNVFRQLG
jgi:ribosome biogenesis protein ENP2